MFIVQLRQIERLLDARVRRARDVFDLIEQLVCILAVPLNIVADDLDIDGRGQSEVQNLADDIGWQKIKSHAGKIAAERLAQRMDILVGRSVIFASDT